MKKILALSVLAACGFAAGCANFDNNAFARHDDRVDSDMLPGDTRADLAVRGDLPEYGLDAATNTKVHYQMAYTDSKGKFRPDWAGGINRPAEHPLPIAIHPADRHTLEGSRGHFHGDGHDHRHDLDVKRDVKVDSTARTDTTIRTDSTVRSDTTVRDTTVRTDPAIRADTTVRTDPAVRSDTTVRTDPAIRTDTTVRQDLDRRGDVIDRRYSIEGNRVVVDPHDPIVRQRLFVDSKGRYRPEWAAGINTPAMRHLTPGRGGDPAFRTPARELDDR